MTKEEVNLILREHNTQVGRCAHIQTEIRQKTHEIALLCGQLGEPSKRAGDSRQAALAFFRDREAYGDSPAAREIEQLEAQMNRLRQELEQCRIRVEYVEDWLEGLTEQERYVIQKHVIDREFWRDVLRHIDGVEPGRVSRETLKRLQNRALEKIYRMAA